jgi:hypothetical protein
MEGLGLSKPEVCVARVFVDESIHDQGDFIVVAVVVSEHDLQVAVDEALTTCGFTPGRDEFKSSMRMADNPAAQDLRGWLKHILNTKCRVAIAVCPVSERAEIMTYAASLTNLVAAREEIASGVLHFDGGMKRKAFGLPPGWRAEFNCDSRLIAGVQVADCAAHILSVMLLSEMGLITKSVPLSNVYPDQEGEMEMAWELWASLRYALSSGEPISGYDEDGGCEPMMKPFGLLVSEACSDEVKAAVEKRFSTDWVGCIH